MVRTPVECGLLRDPATPNDRTNRWAAIPAAMEAEELAETIVRIVGETNNQRYAGLYSVHRNP